MGRQAHAHLHSGVCGGAREPPLRNESGGIHLVCGRSPPGHSTLRPSLQVSFDSTKHLSDASIKKRQLERQKLQELEQQREEQKRREKEAEERQRAEER